LSLGTIGLAALHAGDDARKYFSEVFPGFAVMSIGMGLTFVPRTLLATTKLANSEAGLALGIFNT